MELGTLRRAQEFGATAICIAAPIKKKMSYWITPIEDFFDPEKSFYWDRPVASRALPIERFRIHPYLELAAIAAMMRIR